MKKKIGRKENLNLELKTEGKKKLVAHFLATKVENTFFLFSFSLQSAKYFLFFF